MCIRTEKVSEQPSSPQPPVHHLQHHLVPGSKSGEGAAQTGGETDSQGVIEIHNLFF